MIEINIIEVFIATYHDMLQHYRPNCIHVNAAYIYVAKLSSEVIYIFVIKEQWPAIAISQYHHTVYKLKSQESQENQDGG